MKWSKPWRTKEPKVLETVVGPSTTRLTPVKRAWEATSVAPSNPTSVKQLSYWNTRTRTWETKDDTPPKKQTRKSYWDEFNGGAQTNLRHHHGYDDDYYNEVAPGHSAYPSQGSYESQHGGTITWKNGKRVKNHNLSTYRAPALATKEYAWTPTRWSNYSFGGFGSFGSTSSDDNTRLFIKEPESYLTPSSEDIRFKIHIYTSDNISTVKELCRLFYFKMLGEKDYASPKVEEYFSPETIENKKTLFESAFEGFVPGFTPLEQAVNYFQAILDKEADSNKRGFSGSPSSQMVAFKREDFANPALNDQIDQNALSKKHSMDILNKVSLVGKLGHEFHVEKETGEKEVANSAIMKPKTMTSYSQLDRIAIYERVLPTYKLKFLTKSLQINVPVETSEKKQKIIILVDYSGSMNDTRKQLWLNAILTDRLRYVILGEAEVYISNFVSQPSGLNFQHLKNKSDVNKFWSTMSNYPSGSCTDMGRIVEYVSNEVKGGKRLHNLTGLNLSQEKPEILIINDGQDHCNSKQFPYKVNAISLMEFSTQLKNLCVATGGKQVQVTTDGEVSCHSSEGQVIM
jgi:hypothetical protein